MALILCIETSSKNCSVAISKNGKIIDWQEELDENYCHGEKLHVLIEKLLEKSIISINEIDAFCFSSGPGSYTGLRIGAAAVKGFAAALDKPVIVVSTLRSMAWGLLNTELKYGKLEYDFLCPVLDSRQGEVYTAMYDFNCNVKLTPFACNVNKFSFSNYLDNHKICFFGPGQYKLKGKITHKNASFLENFSPSSRYLGHFSKINFEKNTFVDTAYFEPLYLKEFIPTKPNE